MDASRSAISNGRGRCKQDTVIPWQVIDSEESAAAFASQIGGSADTTARGTSISTALIFATGLISAAPFDERRRVIDVSGDGPNNVGMPVKAARDAALSAGIVINGLPLLVRPSPTYAHLDRYYGDCVIGGPGSFMLPAYDMSEFATAIRRKLILEVSGDMPPPGDHPGGGRGAGRLPEGRARPPVFHGPVFSRARQVTGEAQRLSRNTACWPKKFQNHHGIDRPIFWPAPSSAVARSTLAPTSSHRLTKSRIVQKWMFGVSYQE